MIQTIFALLIIFQVKHFLADYPLQTKYMLGKFGKWPDYLGPLLAHVAVHGVFTFWIVFFFTDGAYPLALMLAGFDVGCHFIMDRIKASPNLLGRFTPLTKETYLGSTPEQKRSNTYFWWSLGLDQSVHHLTHYFIIYYIIKVLYT